MWNHIKDNFDHFSKTSDNLTCCKLHYVSSININIGKERETSTFGNDIQHHKIPRVKF
jgi:hypothetical protein